jgi:hypothetical protein
VSSAGDRSPGRLWSLLEMLELKAKPFMVVAHLLGSLRECAEQPDHIVFRGQRINDYLQAELDTLRVEVEKFYPLGGSTLISIERFKKKLNSQMTQPIMKEMLTELQGRFYDDIGSTYLLSLNLMEQQLFNPPKPLFGSDVSAGFDSLKYEIDELGKCLALGRSTAAAFHAIRCLEGGITAISRCLGIPDPTRGIGRSWGNLLAAIKAEIDRRWPRGNRMHGDGRIFEELYAALAATQNPWRNATMHLDQKYTEQEAKDICDVVRVFMSRLAKRCDENGSPLA